MFGEFPLSSYATDEVYKMVFLTTILALCSSVIPWILWPARRAAITRRKYLITHLEAYLTGAVGLVGTSLFVFYDGRHIVSENAKDYRISVAMAQALATFESAPLTNDPEGDQELVGAWQPFKVDHVLIEALRGSSTGLLYGGRMWGQTNPRMLDASSLLYLRDGKQILRVVVVSPDATRVFLADLLGEWQGRFESGTYIWKTLKELEKVGPLTAEWLLPNQQFLDQLALACDDPLERRPLVRVWGTPIVEGIVIATALQVGNTRAVFLPSGHFRAFADAARPFVGETTLPAPLRLKKG